ncbi:MAG: hypothetical protein ACSHW7_12935 [Patiriisocius sp.]|uniref:hypothetical protein n=1 Tax=Patiriisocius sp. TaxID=2822396 RepID=UPI003EF6D215
MNSLFLPLVNWGIGTVIIGVFAVVCIVIVLVVYSLANGDKKKDGDSESNLED